MNTPAMVSVNPSSI